MSSPVKIAFRAAGARPRLGLDCGISPWKADRSRSSPQGTRRRCLMQSRNLTRSGDI